MPMRLLAISDLHLGNPANRDALAGLPAYPDDWLLVAGDVAETFPRIAWGLRELVARFRRVVWVPGNHELWCLPEEGPGLRGEARYQGLVELARGLGVLTPEDPWPVYDGPGGPVRIVPLFTLYDYSFAADGREPDAVRRWAAEDDIHPVDELLLHADPHPSREGWCDRLCGVAEQRLLAMPPSLPTVLLDHYPLLEDLVRIPRVPRFAPWCGTRRTARWPQRFNAIACVHGHLHVRGTHWRDGIRFEEVSLGYPKQWQPALGLSAYLRQILPFPAQPTQRAEA